MSVNELPPPDDIPAEAQIGILYDLLPNMRRMHQRREDPVVGPAVEVQLDDLVTKTSAKTGVAEATIWREIHRQADAPECPRIDDRDPGHIPGPPPPPPPEIPDLIPGGQLLDTDYPPVEYAIDPIAPLGEIAELTGAHGIFKSTVALAACFSVAAGRRFGGLFARRGRAVFITAEDGERTVALRGRAWLEGVPVGEERRAATAAIRENFSFLAREHVRGLALTLMAHGDPFPRASTLERLTELVKGASLVILETAARLADGNENENRVQATFAMALEEIATRSGAAVGIVRHVSKQAARDGSTDSYAGRGGGALSDAARSVIVFTRERPDGKGDDSDPLAPVTMTHAKATLSRPASKILWQPVETLTGGVYLRALSDDETARANGRKLLAAIPPEGITATELHKHPPAGLGRGAAKAALALLVETGQLVDSTEDRPRNKGVVVYRAARREP